MTPATALLEVTADPEQLDPPVLSVAALQRLSVWRADTVPAAARNWRIRPWQRFRV